MEQGEPCWSFVSSVSGWVVHLQQQDSIARLLNLLGQGGIRERALPSCQLRLVMVCQLPWVSAEKFVLAACSSKGWGRNSGEELRLCTVILHGLNCGT